MKPASVILGVVSTLCFLFFVKNLVYRFAPYDFYVYDTAALLVREGRSSQIYDGGDTGVDPQLRFAGRNSVFGKAALRLGINDVMLYLYPPLVADAVEPYSLVPGKAGAYLWLISMVLVEAAAGILMCMMCGYRVLSMEGAFFVIGAIGFAANALTHTQVVPVLVFLWVAGIYSYMRGATLFSAALFAAATVIKLTPLLVLVPFLYWRRWRWLAGYAASLAFIMLCLVAVNGWASVHKYFFTVLPAMSGGIADLSNVSLPSMFKLAYGIHYGDVPAAAWAPGLASRSVVLLVLGLSVLLLRRASRDGVEAKRNAPVVLAAYALLSVCLAPVSLWYAYAQAFVLLALMWNKEVKEGSRHWRFWFLLFATLSLCTFAPVRAMQLQEWNSHSLLSPASMLLMLLIGIFLALLGIYDAGSGRLARQID